MSLQLLRRLPESISSDVVAYPLPAAPPPVLVDCAWPTLWRELQGQSSWSFCLVHLCRFLGLPEFGSRTLTASLAAYCLIHEILQLRTVSQFCACCSLVRIKRCA